MLKQFVLVLITQRLCVYCAVRAAYFNITELNLSPRWRDGQYVILTFICMLLLPEGQTGEVSEPSKKAMLFLKSSSTGQKSAVVQSVNG
jgi:hypothetical protein